MCVLGVLDVNNFIQHTHTHTNTQTNQKHTNTQTKNPQKVVISTNVAETSITIPDVTVVIDAGRVKENGADLLLVFCCFVGVCVCVFSLQNNP
jgi:hypothetical protein